MASKKQTPKAARLDYTFHIIKDVKANPRREGSLGYQSFALIKSGMTIQKYVEAGGRLADLRWDVDHGFCHITEKK